jgi:hypothetical protein
VADVHGAPSLPTTPEGVEWRRCRRTPDGGWLPVAHAFAVTAPRSREGGSVPTLAVCGLATGPIASPRIPVQRTVHCDLVVPLDYPQVARLKAVPACTKCENQVAPSAVGSDGS